MDKSVEHILENHHFDGKKLRILIDCRARSSAIPVSEVRTYIKSHLKKSRQMLNLWESGKNCPGVNELIWFKNFFGVESIEYFFEKEVAKKKKK